MADPRKFLNVGFDREERAALDRLLAEIKKSVPLLERSQLIRAAVREGLAILEKNPKRALLRAVMKDSTR